MLQVTEDKWDVGDLDWDRGGVPTRPTHWSRAFTCKKVSNKINLVARLKGAI